MPHILIEHESCGMDSGILLALAAIGAAVPDQFQGRYVPAVGSCTSAHSVYVQGNSIDWGDRTDRVIFVERISDTAGHFFLMAPNAARGSIELHFEIQGDRKDYLLVLNHLSDANDIVARGSPIPDKSVIGYYQRCAPDKNQ